MANVEARLAALERALGMGANQLDPVVLPSLHAAFGGAWFTCADALALPDLAARMGVDSQIAMGRTLGRYVGPQLIAAMNNGRRRFRCVGSAVGAVVAPVVVIAAPSAAAHVRAMLSSEYDIEDCPGGFRATRRQ